jgi:ATP phosphoribosyltransferase regulatory subunit
MDNYGERRQRLPQGVYDLLFTETALRREIEEQLLSLFASWGYGEVTAPTFSYLESFPEELGAIERERMIKFLDRRGNILALRPELTPMVARIAATRYKDADKPIRLCYSANAFRYELPNAGRRSEFWQAGVELIGNNDYAGDAEVIALAVEGLERLGLKNFQIGLGQVNFVHGLLEEAELEIGVKEQVQAAINRGDYVALRQFASNLSTGSGNGEVLTSLSSLRGGEEVIAKAAKMTKSSLALDALDNLTKVYDYLRDFGMADRISLDLSLVRELGYYTGIVFEGYAAGIGYPICGGGRYDKLLSYYGCDCGATGFALSIDLLMDYKTNQGRNGFPEVDYLIDYNETNRAWAYQKAKKLRESGYKVVLRLEN